MRSEMGSDSLGTEQLLVWRMLQLSSRRAALVEQRVEMATRASPSSSTGAAAATAAKEALSSGAGHQKKDSAEDPIVVGTVLLSNGEAPPKNGAYNTYRSRPPATSFASDAATGERAVEVPQGGGDPPKRNGDQDQDEATATTPTSSAAAFAKDAEPVSPQSPMRRMMDLKGARPVRRPRGADVIPPHRRSDSDGASGGAYGLGSPSSGSRVSRADAAKAALQREVVRRTLTSLGLPVSADVGLALQRRRAAGAQEESRAGASTDSPTAVSPPSAGRSAFPSEDAGGSGGDVSPSLAADKEEAGTRGIVGKTSPEILEKPVTPNQSGGNTAGAGPPPLVLDAAMTADAVDDEKPTSPTVTQTFSSFLQHLCAVPPPAAAAPAPTPLSYDVGTDSGRAAPSTTHVAPSQTLDVEGGYGGAEFSTPLDDADTSAAASSGASEKSASLSSAPQPSLPQPPPPPYAEAPLPRSHLGAGTFKTAQDLVAHVRLAQAWTILAVRRWHRPSAESNGAAATITVSNAAATDNSDAPSSLAAMELPMLPQRQLSSLMRRKRSTSLKCATASAAAMYAPLLVDGEATLVSDHVDALLPTWAYVASHFADFIPATLASSVTAHPLPMANESTSSASSSSGHRARRSHNSSFSSSLTSVSSGSALAPFDFEGLGPDERLERQACLFPYELAEVCALARLRRSHRPPTTPEVCESDGEAAPTRGISRGALHLLRLELLLDVQQIPPTVRNVSAEERCALLAHALEEFTASGVLPTTVLRSVLNDAALRLLSSVDDEVLRRIAGDGEDVPVPSSAVAAASESDGSAALPSARVAPLSLHVHSTQGDLATTSNLPGPAPLPPTRTAATGSTHSACASTISEDVDSLCHASVTAAAATPTQLVVTVLVHVSPLSPAPAAAKDVSEGTQKPNGATATTAATPPPPPASTSDSEDGHVMTAGVAQAIAQVVLPHLFPASFALSRYATRLSVSSEVDYDALCSISASAGEGTEATPTTCPEADALHAPTDGKEGAECGTAPSDAAPKPWTWVDVDLTELRAAFGLLEPSPVLSALQAQSAPSGSRESGGDEATGSMDSRESPAPSFTRSRTRRSKKKGAAGSGAAAAAATPPEESTSSRAEQPEAAQVDKPEAQEVEEQEPVESEEQHPEQHPEPQQVPALELNSEPHQELQEPEAEVEHEELNMEQEPEDDHESEHNPARDVTDAAKEADVESVEAAGVSDGQLPWDVVKETSALTAATEAMQRRLGAICEHSQLLQVFAQDLEKVRRAQDPVEAPKTRRGHAKGSSKQASEPPLSCAGETLTQLRAVMANTAACLARATLQGEDTPATSNDPLSIGDSRVHLSAQRVAVASRADVVGGSSGDCGPIALVPQAVLPSVLSRIAECITVQVCGPLEQLEAAILESTGSAVTSPWVATIASTSVGEPSGSISDGVSSGTSRQVVGAQVIVKESRRHRRAAARHVQATSTEIGAEREEHRDARLLGDGAEGGFSASFSFLPALMLARALVRLCLDRADQISTASASSSARCTVEGHDGDGAAGGKGKDGSQPHSSQRHRSLSGSSATTSVRLCGTASVAESLHDHVASVLDALQRVEHQLEGEERRWACLQSRLACMEACWQGVQTLAREEAGARQELHTACVTGQASAVAARKAREAAEEAAATAAAAAKAEEEAARAAKAKASVPAKSVSPAPHLPPLKLSPSTSSAQPALDAAAAAAATEEEQDEDAEAVESEQTRDTSPSMSPAPESTASSPTRSRRGLPPLSPGASSTSHTSPWPPQAAQSKGTGKSGGSATSSAKQLRNRNKPSLRVSVGSPAVGGSVGAQALPSPTSSASPSSTTATATLGTPVVRQAQQEAAPGFFAANMDVALIRQAVPFMAIGTALFFLFLVL